MIGQVLVSANCPEMVSSATEWRKHGKAAVAQGLLLATGLAIMTGVIWQIGLRQILASLRPLGWAIIVVLFPYLLVFVLESLGWRFTFPRPLPFNPAGLTLIQIIGKAVNLITPLIPIGGEPVKVHLLHTRGIPLGEGVTSVVISRTVAAIAQGVFVVAVTAFACFSLGITGPLLNAMLGAVGVSAVLVGAFLWAQSRGLFTGLVGVLGRLRLRLPVLEAEAGDLDRRIRGYYRDRRGHLALALLFNLLSCLAEAVEVYVLLVLLALPRSPGLAIGLTAFSAAIREASFAVPGSLGILEGAYVFLFGSLGLAPDAAMAFGILRRLREVAWLGVGFLLLLSGHAPALRMRVGVVSPGRGHQATVS